MTISSDIAKHAPYVGIVITMLREIMVRRQLGSSDCFLYQPNITELQRGSGWAGSMSLLESNLISTLDTVIFSLRELRWMRVEIERIL